MKCTSTRADFFGRFGGDLARLADRYGFVPLPGARRDAFNYGGDDLGESWRSYCARCARAVREAERDLARWRAGKA